MIHNIYVYRWCTLAKTSNKHLAFAIKKKICLGASFRVGVDGQYIEIKLRHSCIYLCSSPASFSTWWVYSLCNATFWRYLSCFLCLNLSLHPSDWLHGFSVFREWHSWYTYSGECQDGGGCDQLCVPGPPRVDLLKKMCCACISR